MTDIAELHARALEATGRIVRSVAADRWHAVTPCPGWDARALVNHLVSGNLWAAELAAGGTIETVGSRLDGDVLGPDPAGSYDASAKAAAEAFRRSGALDAPCAVSYGPVPGSVYAGHRFFDVFTARPAGFGATMEEYAAWLAAQLERLGDPVDLVGHDWGGGFVVRVVSTRPELVRSWVTDAAGVGDAGFEWHDFAKIWQTPQAGEEFWDQQLAASAQERAGVFEMFGVPGEPALDLASHLDRTMAGCILDLYRSAVDVGTRWGPDFAAVPAPGLVIIPGEDPFLSAAPAARAAARAGATTVALDGSGHWWMLEDPARAAAVLREFWATLA